MSKSKEANAEKIVLDYLMRQNRPYSAVDVFNNLHKEIGKTAVTRALEVLANGGGIKEKIYGKQKIYFADQSHFPPLKDEELADMDSQISKMSLELKELQDNIKQNEKILLELNSSLTTDEMKSKLKITSEEVTRLQKKVESLTQSKGHQISKEEKDAIYSEYDKHVKEWRKRKRMATDIIDAVLEGYPKSKKSLLEEVGIETDEDFQVKLP